MKILGCMGNAHECAIRTCLVYLTKGVYEELENPDGYYRQVAQHIAYDILRTRQKDMLRFQQLDEGLMADESEENIECHLDKLEHERLMNQLKERVEGILNQLPEVDRIIFEERIYKGTPYKEIAKIVFEELELEYTANALRQRYFNLLTIMRNILQDFSDLV